jgi:Na+-translocating ferredoxin:NAD+ oxidoreductase RnfD subunit
LSRRQPLRRFLRTPKGLLTAILAIFVAMAAPAEGPGQVMPALLSALLVAGLMDAIILRARRKRWEFPSGAVLTALIVTMILSAKEPWYIAAATSAMAIVSKYLFRSRAGNVFNPAALAIVAAYYLFETGQSWWGALPALAPVPQLALLVAGVFMVDRVDRIPLVLTFLGLYFLLFSSAAFVSDPGRVAEVFRSPDLEAVLFFAFFILTDPPTASVKYPDQIVCGSIVAVVAFAIFVSIGAVHYLLAAVLAGNVWEAWRRVGRRTGHTFPGGVGAFLREVSPWRVRRPQVARN